MISILKIENLLNSNDCFACPFSYTIVWNAWGWCYWFMRRRYQMALSQRNANIPKFRQHVHLTQIWRNARTSVAENFQSEDELNEFEPMGMSRAWRDKIGLISTPLEDFL